MADSKTTALTELTTFSGDETFYVVGDDDGTPVSRRVTVENLRVGLGATTPFKQTIYTGTTNPTTSSTTFGDIDATLYPALSLTLAVDAVVDLMFRGSFKRSAAGLVTGWDWLIDQPTSADTTVRAAGSKAAAWLWESGTNGGDIQTFSIRASFVATEAGVHTFKPQWKVFSSGSATMMNSDANYFSQSLHRVTNLGLVAA